MRKYGFQSSVTGIFRFVAGSQRPAEICRNQPREVVMQRRDPRVRAGVGKSIGYQVDLAHACTS